MKVTVYAQCIGWHRYPSHPTLSNLHRHVFKIWGTFDEKTSREVEFFDAQTHLQLTLDNLLLQPTANSSMSCEDIGKLLLRATACNSVRVSEDGENFVDVSREDLED